MFYFLHSGARGSERPRMTVEDALREVRRPSEFLFMGASGLRGWRSQGGAHRCDMRYERDGRGPDGGGATQPEREG